MQNWLFGLQGIGHLANLSHNGVVAPDSNKVDLEKADIGDLVTIYCLAKLFREDGRPAVQLEAKLGKELEKRITSGS